MKKNNKTLFKAILPWVIVLLLLSSLFPFLMNNGGSKELTYSQFMTVVKDKKITNVTITPNSFVTKVEGSYKKNSKGDKVNFTTIVPKTDKELDSLTQILEDKNVKIKVTDSESDNMIWNILGSILPYVILFGGMFWVFKNVNGAAGGNNKAFEFGNSRAKLERNSKTRFTDVAGADEEKEELTELVAFLKNPKKFTEMGAKIPRGVLLVGPPGTGKTLLARAVAGEANVPFYSISGSEFVEMFVGVGAGRVRDMFKTAKKNAPCLVFIDEIDAVGRQRGAGMGGGNDEREQTLNQLLVEMDGFDDNSGIIVIAATNRDDVLDPALLRAGRFDRQITVDLPDRKGREAILKVHARNKKIDSSVNFEDLAKRTVGFSGADLENVLNEAAILAVRGHKSIIGLAEIDEAIDRRYVGPAKGSREMDPLEKRTVAFHEAGHAVIGLNLEASDKVQKITIIPRGRTGGHVRLAPETDHYNLTKSQLIARIVGYLGGRTSEEIFFKDVSTGASNDIEMATRIARRMVTEFGMSPLGPIQYENDTGSVFLGRDYNSTQKNFSTQIAYEIDTQVRKIIEDAHEQARQILEEHIEDVKLIAETLLKQETITAEEIQYLMEHRHLKSEEPTTEVKTDEPSDKGEGKA